MSTLSRVSLTKNNFLAPLVLELFFIHRLIYRDIRVSIVSGTIFSLSAMKVNWPVAWFNFFSVLVRTLIYFFLYIYNFNLMNQIVGIEEDKINKKDRPLAAGLISLRGAKVRLFFSMILFPSYAYFSGDLTILYSALAWQGIMICYNLLGFDNHWFSKNILFITTGTFVQLTAGYEYGNLPLPEQQRKLPYLWILYISLAFGVTLNLQDLRDILGDLKMGRKTLPIVWGEAKSRQIIAGLICLLPFSLYLIWKVLFEVTLVHYLLQSILIAFNFYVALRTVFAQMWQKSSVVDYDHQTYMIHCLYFCILIGTSLLIL